jgi:hypothetical protein
MKIIFLDLDGVMCTSACYGRGKNNKWDTYMFDHKAVALLNFILVETGAEIILSSDWRHNFSLQEMKEIFCHNGVIKGPIGYTPLSKSYTGDNLENGRAEEILTWVKLHIWKNDVNWVVIDDLNMDEKLFPNFVHCPRESEGIKQIGIKEKILTILNKRIEE